MNVDWQNHAPLLWIINVFLLRILAWFLVVAALIWKMLFAHLSLAPMLNINYSFLVNDLFGYSKIELVKVAVDFNN